MPKSRATVNLLALLLVGIANTAAWPQSDAGAPGAKAAVAAPAKPVQVKPRSGKPRSANAVDASTLQGVARDASQKLAAHATVWLVARRDDAFGTPVETQTDDKGRFSFADFDEAKLLAPGGSVTIVARDEAGRMGWHHLTRADREQPLCEIRLREATLLTGRVLDMEGQPVPGARLTLRSITEQRPEGAPRSDDDSLLLWPDLAANFSTLTTAAGVFEIAGIPRAVMARCELAAEDEKLEVTFESGVAATLHLGKAGSIAGRLTTPEGGLPMLKGFQLQAYLQRDDDRPQEPALVFNATTTVDDEGRFAFAGLPSGGYVIRPVSSQNVPFFVAASQPLKVKPGQHVEDVALPLEPCREVRGRVVDGKTGQGVGSVEVVAYSNESRVARHSQTVQTDAQGHFSVWLAPGKLHARLLRVPVEYLLPPYEPNENEIDDRPVLKLERAATIEGLVVDEEGDAVPMAWLDIQRSAIPRVGAWQNPPQRADREGRFVVEQLEPTEPLVLRARTPTAASEVPLTVVPKDFDGPVRLVISEKHPCWFAGQVVDRGGNPVPAARVAITGHRQIPTDFPVANSFRNLSSVVSVPQLAADGTFETEALYAGDTYQLQITAPGYGTRLSESIRGEAGRLYDFGPLVLDAFVTFAGQVVDADGAPVPNAELRVLLPDGSPQPGKMPARLGRSMPLLSSLIKLHSDEGGAFELPPANAEGVLRIWARAGDFATDGPISYFPDLIDSPLRIELARQPGLRIAGKVVDSQRIPLRATVSIVWDLKRAGTNNVPFGLRRTSRMIVRNGTLVPDDEGNLGSTETNADGTFLTGGLWPGDHYHLVVTADGYQRIESDLLTGTVGDTIDAGTLTLRRDSLAVEGEVVDADGRPVVGATVYNSGDADKPLTAETDTIGRFRLEGLLEGPAYFLVRKDGYWPAGLRCQAGDVRRRVQLVDEKQPRPNSRLPEPAERPSSANRELALRLLSELWEMRGQYAQRSSASSRRARSAGNETPRGGEVARHMASIDFETALNWSAVEGGAFDEVVRIRAFDQIVHDDINLAIAQAGAPGGGVRLKWMAKKRLAAGARDGAMRLLEAALHGNLKTEYAYSQPHAEIRSQAQIGALALAAGRDEWGRRLVNDAADRVERLGGEAEAETRAVVAAALASYDSPRSVRVWEMKPEPPGGVSLNYHNDLAELVGVHDLKAARQISAHTPQPNGFGRRARFPVSPNRSPPNFDPVLVKIACRLARTHPDKALELLKDVSDSLRLEKAETLARAAMALAPRDAERAWKLIDRAFEMCFAEPRSREAIYSRNDCLVSAARTALMAEQAGYPDMTSAVDRVLALRPTVGEQADEAARWASMIEAASVLAIIDPEVARSLLNGTGPPDISSNSFDDTRRVAQWLRAWVLADIEHAERLFDRLLREPSDAISAECINYGLLPAIDSLLGSHDDCVAAVLHGNAPSWFPYIED